MDKEYVSEFTQFMNRFLDAHPEVVKDSQRGWDIYWNPKIEPSLPDEAKEDNVPDDGYGFAWTVWRGESSGAKSHGTQAGK